MSFEAFDTRKIDEYAERAKASWGQTEEYHEYEEKSKGRTKEIQQKLNVEMMSIFAEIGRKKEEQPDAPEVLALVKKLQNHITEYYYTCSDEILLSLGMMYAGGGEFTENIDQVGGTGTAEFTCRAIKAYCEAKKCR
ncbi:MAG: TipAS antibiotic-recognition domain-containing protein [Fusicatenibacter sp.]|nr:TipAS antibiotic-recognition domain-containing protein [Fusicatenibacter sp.]